MSSVLMLLLRLIIRGLDASGGLQQSRIFSLKLISAIFLRQDENSVYNSCNLHNFSIKKKFLHQFERTWGRTQFTYGKKTKTAVMI